MIAICSSQIFVKSSLIMWMCLCLAWSPGPSVWGVPVSGDWISDRLHQHAETGSQTRVSHKDPLTPNTEEILHLLNRSVCLSTSTPLWPYVCGCLCLGLSQGWFSGWRWRRLSACFGASVKVTPSSATQKWTKAWPISTRYANFVCKWGRWDPPAKCFLFGCSYIQMVWFNQICCTVWTCLCVCFTVLDHTRLPLLEHANVFRVCLWRVCLVFMCYRGRSVRM